MTLGRCPLNIICCRGTPPSKGPRVCGPTEVSASNMVYGEPILLRRRAIRCRENMAHTRQPRPDFGPDFQAAQYVEHQARWEDHTSVRRSRSPVTVIHVFWFLNFLLSICVMVGLFVDRQTRPRILLRAKNIGKATGLHRS